MYASIEESGSVEPLYSKTQTVFVKRLSSEEKPRELNVYVTSSTSKVSKQTLFVQITDEDDPYLLYSLLLAEDDYQSLKSVQGLLVDFYNFPHELVRLLEECRKDGKESKFLLMLEEETKGDIISDCKKTYLKVVEANNFKHLCHLQLQVSPGSDGDIKKLMLSKIKLLKEVNSRKEGCISQLNAQVLHLSGELTKRNEDISLLNQRLKSEKLAYEVESTKEINEETERLRRSQVEWQMKMQRERNEMEDKFLTGIREKEEVISKLRIDNQILLDKRNDTEIIIKDQLKQIESLEKELSNVKWDLSSLKKQSSKLDCDYHEKEKSVHSLKTKLAVTEQELKDKVVMLNKLQELLNSCNDQKTRLEECIAEKEKLLRKKQQSLLNISDELMKANEIIGKFQKELTILNSKLKVRTCVALEQEKVVEASKSKMNQLESKVVENEKSIKNLTDLEISLRKKIEELEEQIGSKDKMLKDNERIIEWLNRRIDHARENNVIPSWSPPTAAANSTPFSVPNISDVHNSQPQSVGVDSLDRIPNNSVKSPTVVNETPTTSVPYQKKKTSASTNSKKSLNSKPVGFKRVSFPYQVSTIPSSYFSK